MINKVTLVGRAGHDGSEKVKENRSSGSLMAQLSIATQEKRKNKDGEWEEKTTWHNCSIFGKQAEYVDKYVKKGDLVYIDGSIDQWKGEDGKYHTSIRVNRIEGIPTGNSPRGGNGRDDDRGSRRSNDRDSSRDSRDVSRDSRRDDRGGRDSDRRDPPRRESRDDGYSSAPPDDIPF